MTVSVPEYAEIVSRQQTGHLTAPGIVDIKSENDTMFVPEDAEIMSRQQIGHLTAPEIDCVKSENDTSNVEYSCDVTNALFTEETNVNEHQAKCSYLCDMCKKVFRSQKSLQVHRHIHSRQCRNSCDSCQKVIKKRNYLQPSIAAWPRRTNGVEALQLVCWNSDGVRSRKLELDHFLSHYRVEECLEVSNNVHSGQMPDDVSVSVANRQECVRERWLRHIISD